MCKPLAESASESVSLSEILLLQYFDGVSIPDTFTNSALAKSRAFFVL